MGLQARIERILDRVIGFIAEKARTLLSRMGLGGQPGHEGAEEQPPEAGQLGRRMSVDTGEEEHSVWIVVQSGSATVMAASGSGSPIANLFAAFRARANAPEHAAVQQEAISLIDTAAGHAANLDQHADDAANDPTSPNFNRQAYDEKREEITDTQTLLMGVLRQIMEKLGVATLTPDERLTMFREGSEFRPVSLTEPRFMPKDATNPAEQGYRRSSEVAWQRQNYLEFFRNLGSRGEGPVQVTEAMWNTDIGKAVGSDQHRFARVGSQRYVILDPPPAVVNEVVPAGEEQLDPALEAAVNGVGIIDFMLQVSRGQAPGGITESRLEQLWGGERSTPNRDFLKTRFRSVRPGTHEWVPTDMITEVVSRAARARDLFEAANWIWVHTEMRTPTEQLIFDPDYASQTIGTGRAARRMMQGHIGALYALEVVDGRQRYVAQTVNQPGWHDRLRTAFRTSRSPAAAVGAAHRVFQRTIWTGRAIPPDVVQTYYRSPSGGTAVTVQSLAALQVSNYERMDGMFQRIEQEVT